MLYILANLAAKGIPTSFTGACAGAFAKSPAKRPRMPPDLSEPRVSAPVNLFKIPSTSKLP